MAITGKGQKQLQTQATQNAAADRQTGLDAQKRMLDGSPEFKAYEGRTAARRESINNGTFADSKDFLSNRDAVAARKSQYDASVNMAQTGFGAVGAQYADPNQLAQQAGIQADEFARDSAAQAEADKRSFIGQTEAQESDIMGKKLGVDSSIMGASFGQSNYNFDQAARISAQRASILPSILGGVIGGVGQVAGAYVGRG